MNNLNPENLYGYGTGDHIALIGNLPEDLNALNEVLLGYSCYPPALPKIEQSLRERGRYDCVVQTGWFRSQYGKVHRDLANLGIDLQVVSMCLLSRTPLRV